MSAQYATTGFTYEDSKFEVGKTYCIESVRDNNAHTDKYNDWLDLAYGKTQDGNMIHVWPGNGTAAQKWRVEMDDESEVPRGHLLCTPMSADLKRVVTQKPFHQNGKVVLEEYQGKDEQLWLLIPCAATGNYMIINVKTGKALCNQGRLFNCRCIGTDPDDVNQQWRVVAV